MHITTSIVQAGYDIEELSFSNNSEGAVAIYYSKHNELGNVVFNSNIGLMKSALYLVSSSVSFVGNTLIMNNTGGLGGAIQMLDESSVSFSGVTTFDGNSATAGGAIYSVTGRIELHIRVRFINNRANGDGGALYSSGTNISAEFRSRVTFELNSARRGGGMYLRDKASLFLELDSSLRMMSNHASDYGGGIYHEDSATLTQCAISDNALESTKDLLPYCFLRLGYTLNVKYFVADYFNNSAKMDGSVLYGGLLDKCRLIASNSQN